MRTRNILQDVCYVPVSAGTFWTAGSLIDIQTRTSHPLTGESDSETLREHGQVRCWLVNVISRALPTSLFVEYSLQT